MMKTSVAPACSAESCTARFSTWVMSDGTEMTIRGRTNGERPCAFLMKWSSIFSVTSKSAMTPSFIGRMATMFPGVRPSISLASPPTASTRLVTRVDGDDRRLADDDPRPSAKTSVFAVPRSTARSEENHEKSERRPKGRSFSEYGRPEARLRTLCLR